MASSVKSKPSSKGLASDTKGRKQAVSKTQGSSRGNCDERRQSTSLSSSTVRSSRPSKIYSSSKHNDTQLRESPCDRQQQRRLSYDRKRSYLKTPPNVPVIVYDEFKEDADSSVPHAEYAKDCQNEVFDEYDRFLSDTGSGIEKLTFDDGNFRTSSARICNHRHSNKHSSSEFIQEQHRKCLSHRGSFELSSEDEKTGSILGEFQHVKPSRLPASLDQITSERAMLHQTALMGKEIGEDVTDADFESDDDIDSNAKDNDIKTIFARACRLVGVVSSKRIERELLGDRVYLDYAGLVTADVKAVCIALLNNTTVTRLDLSGNDLCHQAAHYISDLIKENSFITHLFCSTCQLRDKGIDEILASVTNSKNINVLDLSENKLHDDHIRMVASLLKKNKTIRELRLRSCDIDAECGNILGPVLADSTIEKLDLSWNQLRQKGGAAFCLALGENKSIRELDLSWNGLAREGCAALEVTLAKNTSLVQLNLECNRISSECLGHLLKGLGRNRTLESIILTKNPISVEDAKMITSMLSTMPSSAIKVFDISDVTVDNEFLLAQERLQSDRQISIYHGNLLQRQNNEEISKIDVLQSEISALVPIANLCSMLSPSRGCVTEVKHGPRTLSSFDPILVLFEYMKLQNLRLIDLFRNLDVNHDNAISKEELRNGFLSLKMNLPEGVLSAAFHKLDLNSNNLIDIDELKNAHRRVLRQTALMMARSNTKDGDESYGDLLHEFQRLVKVATMYRRSRKSATEDPNSPRSARSFRDQLGPSGEQSKSRRNSARILSGRRSVINSLEPNPVSRRLSGSTSGRRPSSTSSQKRGRNLSPASRTSHSGSERSLSPT